MRAIFLSVDGPHWSRATSTTSSYIEIMTHTQEQRWGGTEGWVMEGRQKIRKKKGKGGEWFVPWPNSLSARCVQAVCRREKERVWTCMCLCVHGHGHSQLAPVPCLGAVQYWQRKPCWQTASTASVLPPLLFFLLLDFVSFPLSWTPKPFPILFLHLDYLPLLDMV